MTSKYEFLLQEGLILSRYIKIINLITSLLFAKRGKKTHQWDFENIFTEAEAGSVSANIGFCCDGEQMGQGNIRLRKNYDKVRPKEEKNS